MFLQSEKLIMNGDEMLLCACSSGRKRFLQCQLRPLSIGCLKRNARILERCDLRGR